MPMREAAGRDCGNTLEITRFASATGPLTKRLRLADDGTLISDGSACVMGQGSAQRLSLAGVEAFASLLQALQTNQAIALGALHTNLPDTVEIVSKRMHLPKAASLKVGG